QSASICDKHSRPLASRTEPNRLRARVRQRMQARTPSAIRANEPIRLRLQGQGCHRRGQRTFGKEREHEDLQRVGRDRQNHRGLETPAARSGNEVLAYGHSEIHPAFVSISCATAHTGRFSLGTLKSSKRIRSRSVFKSDTRATYFRC